MSPSFHIDLSDTVQKQLGVFRTLPLSEAMSVDLNERYDLKFLVPKDLIINELSDLSTSFLLQLNAQDGFCGAYHSLYMDTSSLGFFQAHAKKRMRRMKVRKRTYLDSGACFLEVKTKAGYKTLKKRAVSTPGDQLDNSDLSFLEKNGSYEPVVPTLEVMYNRLTLWDTQKRGRTTIDLDYTVRGTHAGEHHHFGGLAIIEIKGNREFIMDSARRFRFPLMRYQTGFSKYANGIIYTFDMDVAQAKTLYPVYKRFVRMHSSS